MRDTERQPKRRPARSRRAAPDAQLLRLTALVEASDDAIIGNDLDNIITEWNPGAERMFGYRAGEILGSPLSRIVPDDRRGEPDAILDKIRRSQKVELHEALRLTKGGRLIPVSVMVTPILDKDGKVSGALRVLRDITAQRERERQLQRISRLYDALSQVNQVITHTQTRGALFERVCRALVERGGFRMAWIGMHDLETHELVPAGSAGDEHGYLTGIKVYADERPEGQGPGGIAFRTGKAFICNDVPHNGVRLAWRAKLLETGLLSLSAFPVRQQDSVSGVLLVYSDDPHFFQDREIALLDETAANISFALDDMAAKEQREQAEKSARNERQFSATMIESMPGVLYFYDEQGRFLRWNRNFETATGYTGSEIGWMHPLDFIGDEHKAEVKARIEEVFEKGESFVEASLKTKAGGAIPYFFTGRRILYNGMPCLVGMGIDISARKQVEAERRSIEGRYRSLFEHAPDGILVADQDGRYLDTNASMCRMLGYARDELVGMDATGIVVPEELTRIEPAIDSILSRREFHQEWRFRRKDGSTFPAEVFAVTMPDSNILAMIRDITERKQAEEARDRLFKLSLDMLSVADFEGRLLQVNPAWTECLGWSAEALTSRPMIDFIHPDDHAATSQIREKIYAGVTVRGFENRYRATDGSYRWFSWNVHPRPDQRLVFAVARDVTEQKLAVENLTRREQEERMRAEHAALMASRLLESQTVARIGSWETDLVTLGVTWTDETYRIFEVTAASFTPTHAGFMEMVHPDDRAKVDGAFQESLGKEGQFTLEHRIVPKRGPIKVVEECWRIYKDHQGKPVRALGTCQDITARKAAEQELKQREELLSNAQSIAKLGIWDLDLQSGRLTWSDTTCLLFGISPAEFHGTYEHYLSFVLPEDRNRIAAINERVSPQSPLLEGEYRIRRADGEVCWLYERGTAEYDTAGKEVRRLGVVMDVTEVRTAREALRQREAMLAMGGRLARLGSWSVDVPDFRVHWSDEMCAIHEVPAGTQPSLDETFNYYVPEARDPIRQAFIACVRDGTPFDLELESVTAKGRRIWVHAIGEAERDHGETTVRVQGALQDITERKNMEAQFLRAQRLESIGTLAGGIAHDLNNVLSPIMIASDMLEMDIQDPAVRDTIKIIRNSAQRAADLVKQVLSFSRGVEGQRQAVDTLQVVRELDKLAHDTFPKNIRTEVLAGNGVWPVLADPTQVHQVLLNLYVNARDAMPNGGSISAALENQVLDENAAGNHPGAKPGHYVVIRVTDTGAGMPPEVVSRIFDPFFTTKEVGKGTGLGLSTSLGIVKGYGGFMSVYSEPGRGTTFKVYLPALLDETTKQEAEKALEKLPRGEGELILVVDDEEAVRNTVQRTLERFGYRARTAANGAEAVSVYAALAREVAVVITDMSMPVMDGPATAVALRALNPRVVVIGSSGLDAAGQAAQPSGGGMQYFLSKPYSTENMLKTLALAVAEWKMAGAEAGFRRR